MAARISCVFLCFPGFWENLNPQDMGPVALQKPAAWLQVTCLDAAADVLCGRPFQDHVLLSPFTPK